MFIHSKLSQFSNGGPDWVAQVVLGPLWASGGRVDAGTIAGTLERNVQTHGIHHQQWILFHIYGNVLINVKNKKNSIPTYNWWIALQELSGSFYRNLTITTVSGSKIIHPLVIKQSNWKSLTAIVRIFPAVNSSFFERIFQVYHDFLSSIAHGGSQNMSSLNHSVFPPSPKSYGGCFDLLKFWIYDDIWRFPKMRVKSSMWSSECSLIHHPFGVLQWNPILWSRALSQLRVVLGWATHLAIHSGGCPSWPWENWGSRWDSFRWRPSMYHEIVHHEDVLNFMGRTMG